MFFFIASLLYVANAMDLSAYTYNKTYCTNYVWSSDDYRRVNATYSNETAYGFDRETFQEVAARQGWTYMGDEDFEMGGLYYGKVWVHEYWAQLTAGVDIRPLGFRHGRFGPSNNPLACLHTNGTEGHKVELMVFALTPNAKLCMADMTASTYNKEDPGSAPTTCEMERIYGCFEANTESDELHVAIFCDSNCFDMGWTDFLWRFRMSGLAFDDPRYYTSDATEMWCNMIANQVEWPDNLLGAVPETFHPETVNMGESSANQIYVTFGLLLGAFVALLQ